MKVICIQYPIYIHPNLTIGKVYSVIPTTNTSRLLESLCLIKDDGDGTTWYNKNLFISLEEYRQTRLKELLHEKD